MVIEYTAQHSAALFDLPQATQGASLCALTNALARRGGMGFFYVRKVGLCFS